MWVRRGVAAWKKLMIGKGEVEVANMILSDLIGYRKTSLRRADDVTNLCDILRAAEQITLERAAR